MEDDNKPQRTLRLNRKNTESSLIDEAMVQRVIESAITPTLQEMQRTIEEQDTLLHNIKVILADLRNSVILAEASGGTVRDTLESLVLNLNSALSNVETLGGVPAAELETIENAVLGTRIAEVLRHFPVEEHTNRDGEAIDRVSEETDLSEWGTEEENFPEGIEVSEIGATSRRRRPR